MTRSALRLLASACPTVIGATVLIFVLVRLTGDPAAVMLPLGTPQEAVDEFRRENGLDSSTLVQFGHFVRNAVTGDLGNSIRYHLPVTTLLAERLPATVALATTAMVLSVVIALPLGVVGGLRPNSWIDTMGRGLAMIGQAVPVFYLGIILIVVFGVWFPILPTVGNGSLTHLVLPSVTLAAYLIPLPLRVARGGVLDEKAKEYISTARAQGLSGRRVVLVHMLRNALVPVVTIVGMQFGAVLGGSIITEAVFAWPGVGQLLVNAISTRDFPVVQGIVIFSVVAVVLINILVDLSYTILDPRVRRS